ncbi:hypothetical protein OG21DRAFT_1503080 [Imleria badia]|nr:hypothetical protein OG21DRAFT_1503080 [Imleria badia]
MSPNQTQFDVHQVHEVTIIVTTTSPDSNSSIVTDPPTLLLPESSCSDARSSSSSQGTPTVKFAPLPQIDPNRKRSLAPLGVPARSRRKRAIQEDGGSLLWSTDPDVLDENMEDPIIAFAKLVKKTGKTLWRRVRKGSRAVPQEDAVFSAEPVLDISTSVRLGDVEVEEGEGVSNEAVGLEDKRWRRASWSSLAERRTLTREAQRKSTSDLPHLSVIP